MKNNSNVFPVDDSDLVRIGIPSGPVHDIIMEYLKDLWVGNGFKLTREELLTCWAVKATQNLTTK